MIALTAEDRGDILRWIISGAFVLLVHAGIVAALVTSRTPEDFGAPGTVITFDLLPAPDAPMAEPTNLPAGPLQEETEATPEKPVEKSEEKTEQEIPPAPNPEVAVEAPVQQPEQAVEPQVAVPMTTAPQAPQTTNANAVPNWRVHIMELLERNKRYPPEARARHEQGIVQLTFSLDRQGHVTASRVSRSSGFAPLDAEALALVQRVQPFPPPPAEIPGPITLVVPIRFNIR